MTAALESLAQSVMEASISIISDPKYDHLVRDNRQQQQQLRLNNSHLQVAFRVDSRLEALCERLPLLHDVLNQFLDGYLAEVLRRGKLDASGGELESSGGLNDTHQSGLGATGGTTPALSPSQSRLPTATTDRIPTDSGLFGSRRPGSGGTADGFDRPSVSADQRRPGDADRGSTGPGSVAGSANGEYVEMSDDAARERVWTRRKEDAVTEAEMTALLKRLSPVHTLSHDALLLLGALHRELLVLLSERLRDAALPASPPNVETANTVLGGFLPPALLTRCTDAGNLALSLLHGTAALPDHVTLRFQLLRNTSFAGHYSCTVLRTAQLNDQFAAACKAFHEDRKGFVFLVRGLSVPPTATADSLCVLRSATVFVMHRQQFDYIRREEARRGVLTSTKQNSAAVRDFKSKASSKVAAALQLYSQSPVKGPVVASRSAAAAQAGNGTTDGSAIVAEGTGEAAATSASAAADTVAVASPSVVGAGTAARRSYKPVTASPSTKLPKLSKLPPILHASGGAAMSGEVEASTAIASHARRLLVTPEAGQPRSLTDKAGPRSPDMSRIQQLPDASTRADFGKRYKQLPPTLSTASASAATALPEAEGPALATAPQSPGRVASRKAAPVDIVLVPKKTARVLAGMTTQHMSALSSSLSQMNALTSAFTAYLGPPEGGASEAATAASAQDSVSSTLLDIRSVRTAANNMLAAAGALVSIVKDIENTCTSATGRVRASPGAANGSGSPGRGGGGAPINDLRKNPLNASPSPTKRAKSRLPVRKTGGASAAARVAASIAAAADPPSAASAAAPVAAADPLAFAVADVAIESSSGPMLHAALGPESSE